MIAPAGHVVPRSWGGAAVDKRLWYLLAGTRGGVNRARILWSLHERARNANDLASLLALDYKTVRHHLEILRENDCVMAQGGEGYGMAYTLSPRLQNHFDEFLRIWERLVPRGDEGKVQNSRGPMEVAR
jgi:DNA-binding transcriptional ArsR family regulator